MSRFLWICLFGAAGTGARYLLSVWTAERVSSGFPLATLAVNIIGCFAMAIVVEGAFRAGWPETLRLALTAGLLGGFTTYSSFNFEATRLLETGAATMAAAYVLVTLLGACAAGLLGLAVGRHLFAG